MLSPPFAIVELDLQQVEESLTYLPLVRSFTDMLGGLAEKENPGWVVMSLCHLSRGRRGKWKLWWTGGGVCSAVSGRAGHLITERVLLHHHQSHAGSLLPPNRPGCRSSRRAQDMDCGLSTRALEGLELRCCHYSILFLFHVLVFLLFPYFLAQPQFVRKADAGS